MKKKLLISAACLGLSLFGLSNVSAKEVSLATGETATGNNIYIVGSWVFQLNSYGINGKDIAYASGQYAARTGKKDTPVYYIVGGSVLEYDSKGASAVPKQLGTVAEVFPGSKINASGLNGEEYDDEYFKKVEPEIIKEVDKLNENADTDGFYSVTYENGTLTFNIKDSSKSLAEYGSKSSIVEFVKKIVSEEYGFEQIKYTLDTEITKTKENLKTDTSDAEIKKLAKEVLEYLAKQNDSEYKTLNYASVANQEISATVTYKDKNQEEYNVTYTLKFVYDFETEKDKALNSVAEKLNETVQEALKGTEKNYGFKGVTYEDGKVTFDILDPSASLSTFAESDIVSLFKTNYSGATKIVYSMNGKEAKTITINKELDETEIKKYAGEVLKYMSEDDDAEAKDLSVGSVANKSVTAIVTYVDGTEVTYTLSFTFDAETVKDDVLSEYATELSKKISQLGFKSVKYDPQTNAVLFEISDPSKKFIDNVSLVKEIAGMFDKWSAGATEVIYWVNEDTTGDGTKVEFGGEEPTSTTQLALQLLTAMAGDEDLDTNMTIGAVAGTSAKADFYFVGQDKPNTYTVEFKYDAQESLYETLEGDVTGLKAFDAQLADSAYFDNIIFENGKATFTVKKDKASSKFSEYGKMTEVLGMFDDAVEGATEIKWTVDDSSTNTNTYTLGTENLEKFNGKVIAKDLLSAMAGGDKAKNPTDITLQDVAGKKATAEITYKIGKTTKTVNLELEFVIADGE